MAVNKSSPSQAEKAAQYSKNRQTNSRKKTDEAVKKPAPKKRDDPRFSEQGKACVTSLILFLLFATMALNPEGKVILLARDFLLGLFGKGAFIMALLASLFLFVIFARRKSQPVKLKIRCAVAFALLFGVLHHLLRSEAIMTTEQGLGVVSGFYSQGIRGESGGLICGFVGFFLRWAFGKPISVLFIFVGWFLVLLAAVDVTIPKILRAVREQSDGLDEDDDACDNSQRLVSWFMSRKRNTRPMGERFRSATPKRRQVPVEPVEEEDEEEELPKMRPPVMERVFRQKKAEPEPIPAAPQEDRMRDMMRQIDMEDDFAPMPEPPAQAVPVYMVGEPVAVAPVAPDPAVKKVTANEAAASAAEVAAEIARAQQNKPADYQYPPIDLLKIPAKGAADGTAEMKRNSARLNESLESFKIDAHIINVTRGPSVTRYEVELDKGVRLNKLTSVADDLALSLGVTSVRIAPVPGKISVVGIEVPNQIVTNVNLREVIDSREFGRSASKSTFAVGKDIGGNCIVGNIAKMPHMLIAGTTGSGKSVCMNSIIISLLYKASPAEVKLIMVDPKMVELGIYNDIPHLLIPVVTDPKKAAGSLQWAVTEMMRRYRLMSDAGVRDLESFNSIVESEGEGEKLPQVVVIIDELADLMLVAAKEVEDSICRIAQMGRAAGMHLIIATQRPSADVITGLMKANIPSRIAFSVASAMESRIILDTQGAEKLVGRGDMLYAPIGTGKPQRVQGCFVSDAEVEAVATFVKGNSKASYDENIIDEIEKAAVQNGKKGAAAAEPEANAEEMEGDEMLPAAVEVILETGQASVSMLQRRLKLGYARAARIVDEMEEKGIVGPFQGSKPRTIQITKEQWADMKAGMGLTSPEDVPFDMDEE